MKERSDAPTSDRRPSRRSKMCAPMHSRRSVHDFGVSVNKSTRPNQMWPRGPCDGSKTTGAAVLRCWVSKCLRFTCGHKTKIRALSTRNDTPPPVAARQNKLTRSCARRKRSSIFADAIRQKHCKVREAISSCKKCSRQDSDHALRWFLVFCECG